MIRMMSAVKPSYFATAGGPAYGRPSQDCADEKRLLRRSDQARSM